MTIPLKLTLMGAPLILHPHDLHSTTMLDSTALARRDTILRILIDRFSMAFLADAFYMKKR